MIKQSDVTIIIPYFGVSKEEQYAMKECLQSLLETCECSIVIVLNGVSGEASTNNQNRISVIDPIHMPNERITRIILEKQGQCMAVNAAAATIDIPVIFVTNDDMIYHPGW